MGIRFAGGVNLGSGHGIQLGRRYGAPDALAGVPLLARLQTHVGNGVPIGMFQDTAGAVPAILDGDPVARWEDAISGLTVRFLQPTNGRRPTLKIIGGIPRIRSTSLGISSMTSNVAISPVGLISLIKQNVGVFGRVSSDGVGSSTLYSDGSDWHVQFSGADNTIGTITSGFDLIEGQGAIGATYSAINGVETSLADGAFAGPTAYSIFDFIDGGGQVLNCDMIAFLVPSAPLSLGDKVKIRNYLPTLD